MKTHNTDRIEDFIEGSMPAEEAAKFNKELETDYQLKTEYEERLRIASAWQKAKTYWDTKKEVAAAIVYEKSRLRKKIVGYSVAASFLLIATLSVVLFFNRGANPPGQVANNKEETITPQIKMPEEKASAGVIKKIVLLYPVNDNACSRNDSLVFRWSPALADSSFIVIGNEKTQNLVYREKLKPGKVDFKLERQFLPVGQYYWQIENYPEKQKFRVVE